MKRKRQREPCTQGSKARSRPCGSNPPLPSILAKMCISHTQAMQACVLSKRLHSLICPRNQVLPFQALVLATIRSWGLLTAGFNYSSSIMKDQSHCPLLFWVIQEGKILIIFALGQVSTIFFISTAKMKGTHMLWKPDASYLSADYRIINVNHQPVSPRAL